MLHEIKHVQVGTSTDPINETKIACKKVYFSAWDSMECILKWMLEIVNKYFKLLWEWLNNLFPWFT